MADNIEPISHLEKVIAGEESPITHLEQVIALYGGTGGSGGSGTTNYNALLNKPSINGVTLTGNKSLSDLGINLSKYTTTDKAVTSIELVDAIPTGSTGTTTEKCLRLTFADGTTVVDVSIADLTYDDTQVKADIAKNKSDIADLDTNKQDKTDNALDTTDKTVVGAINEINDSLLDNVTFSADYKNIIINRKSGLNPYTIPISSIIHNAKLTELNDVDSTNIGDGKTLVYDGATKKHKYVDSTGTDELVKMDSTTNAKHLGELIDKTTIVNDNGVLKVKKLDGQQVTIAEINHLKGLTMNVMDLVKMFSNGGVKIINTPVATHADLLAYDKTGLIDGISYLVYVLADETHDNAKTTYLIDKTSSTPTYFGFAGEHRDFITNPIDLANEVTGKLGTSNIDVDALWSLLTINDTYKTLTTKNEVFGTHGAKALYDELVANIGKKANNSDLTTHTGDNDIHITTSERNAWNNKANATDLTNHTGDTNIHVTTSDKTKWNNVDNKVNKTDIIDNLTSTNTDKPLSANQGKVLKSELDKKANDSEVVKKTDIVTTISNTSTDKQIPSAKSVFDNIKKNGLIWQGTQQLQNSQESSIYDYCKSNFIVGRICCFRLEPKDGSGYFSSASVTIIYCLSSVNYGWILGLSDKSGIPMAIIQIAENNIKKWQRVCTTGVADVPVTNIAPSDTTTFVNFKDNSNCNYCVKNGVCYVSLWGVKITKTGGTIKPGVILPKSANNRAGALMTGTGDATEHAFAFIIDTGELCFDVKDANIPLYCSFSYPVKES